MLIANYSPLSVFRIFIWTKGEPKNDCMIYSPLFAVHACVRDVRRANRITWPWKYFRWYTHTQKNLLILYKTVCKSTLWRLRDNSKLCLIVRMVLRNLLYICMCVCVKLNHFVLHQKLTHYKPTILQNKKIEEDLELHNQTWLLIAHREALLLLCTCLSLELFPFSSYQV